MEAEFRARMEAMQAEFRAQMEAMQAERAQLEAEKAQMKAEKEIEKAQMEAQIMEKVKQMMLSCGGDMIAPKQGSEPVPPAPNVVFSAKGSNNVIPEIGKDDVDEGALDDPYVRAMARIQKMKKTGQILNLHVCKEVTGHCDYSHFIDHNIITWTLLAQEVDTPAMQAWTM